MKVRSVEAIPVAYPEPNDFDATRHLCLVRLESDEGMVGWGEAITQFPEASFAAQAIISGMSDVVVGRDPVQTTAIWHDLRERAWWYGHGGGVASSAIAALDIALWDLKGKILGRSVCDLLGGSVHPRLPVIASSHAHHPSIPAMADEAVGWMEQGFQGMKVGFGKRGDANLGYDHDRDVEYVREMRRAIGPDRSLMIDIGARIRWDVTDAVRRVRAFDEHDIDWIEEPLGAWDPEGYANLRSKVTTRIAYGEREWTPEGFERVLETETVDVVGVDPARAEGITGFKRITDSVERHRRQANAHAWSSAICTAASLAISFSSPACKVFEFKPLRNPMQHDLVTEPFEQVDGWIEPPVGRPGLGIDVLEEVVDRYRVDATGA